MNNEFLHMQKLAGLITESEYQAKMNEGDYDSMSDHALIKAANEAGIEEMVEMDGEGGLANREEVIDHLNEFEHDNHGSFDAEMNEAEEPVSDALNESPSHTLTADEYRRKESPHLDAHGGNEVDFMDAMEFAKDYARYVASIACQEFLDTTLPQEAIDEFLKGFGL